MQTRKRKFLGNFNNHVGEYVGAYKTVIALTIKFSMLIGTYLRKNKCLWPVFLKKSRRQLAPTESLCLGNIGIYVA
jgi:hypothetical protein